MANPAITSNTIKDIKILKNGKCSLGIQIFRKQSKAAIYVSSP